MLWRTSSRRWRSGGDHQEGESGAEGGGDKGGGQAADRCHEGGSQEGGKQACDGEGDGQGASQSGEEGGHAGGEEDRSKGQSEAGAGQEKSQCDQGSARRGFRTIAGPYDSCSSEPSSSGHGQLFRQQTRELGCTSHHLFGSIQADDLKAQIQERLRIAP